MDRHGVTCAGNRDAKGVLGGIGKDRIYIPQFTDFILILVKILIFFCSCTV